MIAFKSLKSQSMTEMEPDPLAAQLGTYMHVLYLT